MKIKQKADWCAYAEALGKDNNTFLRLLEFIPVSDGLLLDWGGGEGKFITSILKDGRFDVVNMDPDFLSLQKNLYHGRLIQGIGQNLPFIDNVFVGVHVNAALHHAPNDLYLCLFEIRRVIKKRCPIILWEPLDENIIANIARKLFVEETHDINEKPLNHRQLLKAVSSYFDIVEVKYYWLFSYTLPFLFDRMPLRSLGHKITVLCFSIDGYLLQHFTFLKRFSSYIRIVAVSKNENYTRLS